ncbi:MAG TPA: DUF4139 domain-containing protein [Rhizomicrobium sp.]|nr:DUF4139 domain-containing protein [Rhizomicrobium sp.]
MRIRTVLLGALALGIAAAGAAPKPKHKPRPAPVAQARTEAPQPQLSLTVYNNDLVMVQDIRTLDLPAGRSRIEFPGVSAAIRPETVSLTAKGLSVVEQNFDYDLLTPAKMMEKQVGHDIQIVRINPATGVQTNETATVLSVNSGVVLRVGNHIEALRDDGLPTRVMFGAIPENLRASPTLSVTVDAETGGPRQVNLSYLGNGLSWDTAYVGLYDEKRDLMSLQGWITIRNSSGTSFKNADTELVAGTINTTFESGSQNYARNNATVRAGSGEHRNADALGDFYTYRVPERVTVANQQTKQIAFLDVQGAHATKLYEYQQYGFGSEDTAQHVKVDLAFSNSDAPLPQGTVRIYMRDAKGDPKFVGESYLGHTPAGSDILLELGEAFDVTVQPTLLSTEAWGKAGHRYKMSYLLRNARGEAVNVELRQQGLYNGGDVEDESLKSRRLDAHTLLWNVPVPAHGETTLTATIEVPR